MNQKLIAIIAVLSMTGFKYLQLKTIQPTTIVGKYENKLETLRVYLGSQQVNEKLKKKSFQEHLSNKQTTEVVLKLIVLRIAATM